MNSFLGGVVGDFAFAFAAAGGCGEGVRGWGVCGEGVCGGDTKEKCTLGFGRAFGFTFAFAFGIGFGFGNGSGVPRQGLQTLAMFWLLLLLLVLATWLATAAGVT